MARGQNTANHPNRRVDRPAFSEVIIRQAASPELSPKEKSDYDDFVSKSDLQNRYEGLDRGINFPLGRG